MKTRAEWAEEVMEQADCYAKSFMCEVLARSHTAAVLPANAVKNMEHEKLRALLLEVPNSHVMATPEGYVCVPRKAIEEVVRISDRKHDAWDAVKEAIAASPEYKG
jgi:mannose-1-phosphate guanylyltransferase